MCLLLLLLLLLQTPAYDSVLESSASTVLGLIFETDLDLNLTRTVDVEIAFDPSYHTICIEDILGCESCPDTGACSAFKSQKIQETDEVT